ncbi:MAG: L,D-transpeptidase family protein [Desulfosalsimonas sp.]
MKYIALLILMIPGFVHAGVDLVSVDKSERKMYLIENGKIIREYDVALGKNPKGHKEQRGDNKTPEGIYTLGGKNENSSFYRAMHISYPNENDIVNARKKGVSPGGFIMVHGLPDEMEWFAPLNKELNWTNGCIALTNEEMDEFMELVETGTKIKIEW